MMKNLSSLMLVMLLQLYEIDLQWLKQPLVSLRIVDFDLLPMEGFSVPQQKQYQLYFWIFVDPSHPRMLYFLLYEASPLSLI